MKNYVSLTDLCRYIGICALFCIIFTLISGRAFAVDPFIVNLQDNDNDGVLSAADIVLDFQGAPTDLHTLSSIVKVLPGSSLICFTCNSLTWEFNRGSFTDEGSAGGNATLDNNSQLNFSGVSDAQLFLDFVPGQSPGPWALETATVSSGSLDLTPATGVNSVTATGCFSGSDCSDYIWFDPNQTFIVNLQDNDMNGVLSADDIDIVFLGTPEEGQVLTGIIKVDPLSTLTCTNCQDLTWIFPRSSISEAGINTGIATLDNGSQLSFDGIADADFFLSYAPGSSTIETAFVIAGGLILTPNTGITSIDAKQCADSCSDYVWSTAPTTPLELPAILFFLASYGLWSYRIKLLEPSLPSPKQTV